jgi:uncharacterized protein DUF3833
MQPIFPCAFSRNKCIAAASITAECKMAIDDFRDTRPAFIPEEFFLGDLEGWAVFESLTGGLLRRASIKARGTLEPGTDTVLFIETYTFDDGHTDTLHWTIRKKREGQYSGLENRLIGEAAGEQSGCAFTGNIRGTRLAPTAAPSVSTSMTGSTASMTGLASFAEVLAGRAYPLQLRT